MRARSRLRFPFYAQRARRLRRWGCPRYWNFFEKLLSYTRLSSAVFSPLLKTVAIALLGQVAGAFCQDAGQGALGKMVELCGTVLCLCTGLPLATMLLELLLELGGG